VRVREDGIEEGGFFFSLDGQPLLGQLQAKRFFLCCNHIVRENLGIYFSRLFAHQPLWFRVEVRVRVRVRVRVKARVGIRVWVRVWV
jgi:hypothetical protein